MDVVDQHRRVVEGWLSRVAGVGDDQWNLPPPCAEWSVRVERVRP